MMIQSEFIRNVQTENVSKVPFFSERRVHAITQQIFIKNLIFLPIDKTKAREKLPKRQS